MGGWTLESQGRVEHGKVLMEGPGLRVGQGSVE